MNLEEPEWTQYDFSGNYMLFDEPDSSPPKDGKIRRNETACDNEAKAVRSQYGTKPTEP